MDRSDYQGIFAPGYHRVKAPPDAATGQNLLEVDHCVGNVALGDMNRFVEFYKNVLGFAQLIHYDDKVIHTDYSALMSKVMTNGNGRIKFPTRASAGKKKRRSRSSSTTTAGRHAERRASKRDIVAQSSTARARREVLGCPHGTRSARPVGDGGVSRNTIEERGIEATVTRRAISQISRARCMNVDFVLRSSGARLARLRRRQIQGALRSDRDRAARRGNL